ncbi:MAG TPA: signal peptidase I, partial [Clostridiales bacterium]|nr:signal peptidase I [Clostridiales bacterium]
AAPTVAKLDRHSGEEHVVPEHCVFVMGDNRNDSTDSRDERIGMVDTRDIIGKVVFIAFPFDHIGSPYK